MSSLKFTSADHWSSIEHHLQTAQGERFAFAHTRQLADSPTGPILEVVGVELIEDDEVVHDASGWSLRDPALDRVHNAAVRGGYGLIEFHNHRLGPPGFSLTDEAGLETMSDYVTHLLPNHVYGAGVFAEGHVRVEFWRRTRSGIERNRFRSVVLLGNRLRLLDRAPVDGADRLSRQALLLDPAALATLTGLRVALVGAGGTGAQAGLTLGYLGVRDVLILDDDLVELTNLNRLVTACRADIGDRKNEVTERRLKAIGPELNPLARAGLRPGALDPELLDVDLIIGCVDHDGPRDQLNQLAVDTCTPYIDVATGIEPKVVPPVIGGRVTVISPGNPCLHCLGELDAEEVSRWAKSDEQQALDRAHGYDTDEPSPAVVHLNGIAVNAAMAELVEWVRGDRPPAQYLDIDISGHLAHGDAPPGCRVTPRAIDRPRDGCIACGRIEPGDAV